MISFKEWKSDLPAGLVVFFVAIPLCLGIALASGAPLFSGVIAGIVGGMVVTLFSDSALGVSGPAAGLVAIAFVAIQEMGFEAFLTAVVVAGVIQLFLGFLNLGIIGYYFPSAVINGMLAAIGLIIILKQLPHAAGYDADFEGDLAFAQLDGHNTFSELSIAFGAVSPGAISICLFCMAILVIWERPFIKRLSFSHLIQGPVVVVVAGIAMHLLFRPFPELALRGHQMVSLPTATSIRDYFGQFLFPDLSVLSRTGVYVTGLTLAVVASLESLLCAEATDKLDPYKRTTDLNRELKAQGIGNIVAGLVGGLPITQVIVRSSTNVQSGARTRAAAFFHGVLILVCASLIAPVLNLIPLASLAAILFVVGYKLAHPSKFVAMYRAGWEQFLPFMTTVITILAMDLLAGIGIGVAVSIFFILRNHFLHSYWLHEQETGNGTRIRLVLSEHVSFLNKGSILKTLREIPPRSSVLIDASGCVYIDPDVLDILKDFEPKAAFKEIELEIRGIGDVDRINRPVKSQLIAAPEDHELRSAIHHRRARPSTPSTRAG